MNRLSSIPAPALAGVIREKTSRAAMAEIKNCVTHGADMIDLHLSCLEKTDPETLKEVIGASPLPVLALHYNKSAEWEDTGFTEEERTACMLRAVDAGAAGIDMQGYTFDPPSKDGYRGRESYSFTQGNPREVVTDSAVIDKQCDLIERVHAKGAEVLLSTHPNVAMNCTQVVELALFLEKRKPDIIKLVTLADTQEELAESIRTMLTLKKEVKTPVSFHAGGAMGSLSRIVNPILGGQIIFCVDRFSSTSTMSQVDLCTARTVIDSIRRLV